MHSDGDDSEFSTDLILLYIAYDAEGNLRQQIMQEHSALLKSMGCERLHDLLTTYLNESTLEFANPEDMEAFLRVKQSELISMRRQQKKISSMESHHHDKLLSVIQEQSQFAKGLLIGAKYNRAQEPMPLFSSRRFVTLEPSSLWPRNDWSLSIAPLLIGSLWFGIQ